MIKEKADKFTPEVYAFCTEDETIGLKPHVWCACINPSLKAGVRRYPIDKGFSPKQTHLQNFRNVFTNDHLNNLVGENTNKGGV